MRSPYPARIIDAPEIGYFCRQKVPKGWEVPGQICRTDSGEWYAIVDGVTFPPAADPHDAERVMEIWQGWRDISEVKYRWLNEMREWATIWDPTHAAVNTLEPVDFRRMKPILIPPPKGSS